MDEIGVAEAQEGMTAGRWSARELCDHYLGRIDRLDRGGPTLNSIIEVNPDAPAIADALDRERARTGPRSALHGIPVVLKDNIDTCDRMQTTAGSLALEGCIASRDAFLVERLREAGAVILGKSNLSEWANFRGLRSVSGWSSRGGLTRNPYALDRSASGSSSGSAVAVAADLCILAVGTETDGSITSPSSVNGIVGIKPTLGAVSRRGVIPIAHSQDTAGPMARTVADAALLLGVLSGHDPEDRATRAARGRTSPDYRVFLREDGLAGARIGIARSLSGSAPHVLRVFERAVGILREQGAVLIDPVDLPGADVFGETESDVLHFEFKADLDRYLESRGPSCPVRTMADVIKFNESNAKQVMPHFGQELMVAAQAKPSLRSRRYREALAKNHRLTREEGIEAAMAGHDLDAVVVPSSAPAWLIDLVNGDSYDESVQSTSLPAVAGYPHITVPAGHVCGLPVGISFWGRAWDEGALVRIAHSFEQATDARRRPRYLASADVPGSGPGVSGSVAGQHAGGAAARDTR